MKRKAKLESDSAVAEQIKRLERAYRKYCHIMTGFQEPEPVLFVMGCKDWRPKAGALSAAGDRIEFGLLELAAIIASVLRADVLSASRSLNNPVNQAALYLRTVKRTLPPAFIELQGKGVIAKAADSGDCDFFIKLGNRLAELKTANPEDIDLDSMKLWLVLLWRPCYIEGRFWPGLAYMRNPARAEAYGKLERDGQDYPERTLRGTWRRLGLKPAKSPFIRTVQIDEDDRIGFS